MNIAKYLTEMKNIQENFLDFLENVENIEESFNNLKIKFENMKIRDNKHDFRLFLHLISSISDNHFRSPTFLDKIERVLQHFKDDIKNYYSNSEIFNIFSQNKRILLFLIKEEIITVDEYVAKKITTDEFIKKNYHQYFLPEIKRFENKKWFPKNELFEYLLKEFPDDFDLMRNKGENESFICKLIREDSVEDFITYIVKNCISPNSIINPSIYETNLFLLEKQSQSKEGVSLIEYAAFFGSIQIFTFLKNEKAELAPSLWMYAIHSQNAELIHLIEELHIETKTNVDNEEEVVSYIECFNESIKCHHNAFAYYFINNYLQTEDEYSKETFIHSLEYYNFLLLQNELVDESSFCHLCHYDYYTLFKDLLTKGDFDINIKYIQNHIIQMKF